MEVVWNRGCPCWGVVLEQYNGLFGGRSIVWRRGFSRVSFHFNLLPERIVFYFLLAIFYVINAFYNAIFKVILARFHLVEQNVTSMELAAFDWFSLGFRQRKWIKQRISYSSYFDWLCELSLNYALLLPMGMLIIFLLHVCYTGFWFLLVE